MAGSPGRRPAGPDVRDGGAEPRLSRRRARPARDGPAARVADRHIHADYLDAAGLARLAGLVRAATTEFENVPPMRSSSCRAQCRVRPAAASVAIAQDRIAEKTFLAAHGVGVAPFAVDSHA